jgi:hypothetical protein
MLYERNRRRDAVASWSHHYEFALPKQQRQLD